MLESSRRGRHCAQWRRMRQGSIRNRFRAWPTRAPEGRRQGRCRCTRSGPTDLGCWSNAQGRFRRRSGATDRAVQTLHGPRTPGHPGASGRTPATRKDSVGRNQIYPVRCSARGPVCLRARIQRLRSDRWVCFLCIRAGYRRWPRRRSRVSASCAKHSRRTLARELAGQQGNVQPAAAAARFAMTAMFFNRSSGIP